VLLSVAPACRLPILGVKQISCLIKVDRPFKVHGELGDQRKGKWDATIFDLFRMRRHELPKKLHNR
jgi:hypothetical protein